MSNKAFATIDELQLVLERLEGSTGFMFNAVVGSPDYTLYIAPENLEAMTHLLNSEASKANALFNQFLEQLKEENYNLLGNKKAD